MILESYRVPSLKLDLVWNVWTGATWCNESPQGIWGSELKNIWHIGWTGFSWWGSCNHTHYWDIARQKTICQSSFNKPVCPLINFTQWAPLQCVSQPVWKSNIPRYWSRWSQHVKSHCKHAIFSGASVGTMWRASRLWLPAGPTWPSGQGRFWGVELVEKWFLDTKE